MSPLLMMRKGVISGFLLLMAGTTLAAQDSGLEEILPAFKDKAVVIDMIARILEDGREEVWNSVNSKVTIPGRPVGLKMVGANIIIAAQFTPYIQPGRKNFLVAQGQIWIEMPGEGIRYFTSIQTIPLEFGEEVLFFPLGHKQPQDDALIEIKLALRPYAEEQTVREPR
ncbi:MAG: hypothetical protein LBI90_04530 [Treponema sp.]|nr:hypothetical protein [Treponema sp.]